MNELARKKCVPCEGGVAPLTAEQIKPMLKGMDGWALQPDGMIAKTYKFKNYFETMAFVNYITHAIQGLSENDFICAAKLDALFEI
jgi:4a-hydroxytetrahydrobiopterin dehydratase